MDIQESYFDRLKHCLKFIPSEVKVYSKYRRYFQNYLVLYFHMTEVLFL